MNIAIWVMQGLLAVMFTMAGTMKATQDKAKLAEKMPWANDYSASMIKFIGVSELLGGIGLIVPQLTGILPILTPLAAFGLVVVMVLAAAYHLRKGENKEVIINVVLLALAAIVGYYRFTNMA
jgi:uncharacterized membrane protein YphA (DoxX/SURF4 family)